MKSASTRLSHIEINVSNYVQSIKFYDLILVPLGWERLVCTKECTTYCDGFLKIILSPVEDKFKELGFHRKRIGLNHLALYANSQEEVDSFYRNVLQANSIPTLYTEGPDGDEEYYMVLFEDPDRMKLELTYAPYYCKKGSWPNNLESDFDPYL